jgi:sugar transferase (PEP-CTERM system associated)
MRHKKVSINFSHLALALTIGVCRLILKLSADQSTRQQMLRIFGHHISQRAILIAVLELTTFIAIYFIAQVLIAQTMAPDQTGLADRKELLPLFCLIAFVSAAACGLYNKEMSSQVAKLVPRLLFVSVLMYGLMLLALVATGGASASPQHPELYYVTTLAIVGGYLVTAFLFRHRSFDFTVSKTLLGRRVLVVGAGDCAAKIDYLSGASRSPYDVVGFVPVKHEALSTRLDTKKVLRRAMHRDMQDAPARLLDQARALGATEIVVASRVRRALPVHALMECKLAGIAVTEFASFWERQTGQIDLEELNLRWLVFCDGFRMSRLLSFIKRSFDIVIALAVLLFTLPITVAAAIAIKLDSAGPLFYRQERVGLNGRVFTIYKFRSMRVDAEKDGVARWAQRNDDRVTRVGRFIRRTRIDEIPQVLNVLLGDMSCVGPRPERPAFVQDLARKIPHYDVRHRIKPGITGWAQINYPYGASDEDARAKLAYDLYYAKNWSLFLDIVILVQTARVVFWPEGVR